MKKIQDKTLSRPSQAEKPADLFSTPESDARPPAEAGPKIHTVTEITRDVRSILESAFDAVWVEGEISNFRAAASQHAYFILKDDQAQIRCVMFRGQRTRLKFQPADGDQVLLFGRMAVYEARGEYQIIVETLEPRGLGALQKAFEQLKEKLSKEGLFDEARKRPLPPFPWKIGVITSPTGAVIRDIINVLTRRNPNVSILLHPVKVQGEGAAQEIAAAIEAMNQFHDIDALIVGRGGGSIEDLWAFNEECVARAILASRIPVISAVGHEVDFTIADFVADVRAPTPSAAAEIVAPVLADIIADLRHLALDLVSLLRGRIEDYREILRNCIDRRFFREPSQIVEPAAQRLDELNGRLARALDRWVVLRKERLGQKIRQLFQTAPERNIRLFRERVADMNPRLLRALDRWVILRKQELTGKINRLSQASPRKPLLLLKDKQTALEHRLTRQMSALLQLQRESFDGAARNLNALSPLAILDRGYSICAAKTTGKSVKSSAEVRTGDAVEVRLAKGKLDCIVDKTIE